MAASAASRRPASLRRAAELGAIELIAIAFAVAALAQPAPHPAVVLLALALAVAALLLWLRTGRKGHTETVVAGEPGVAAHPAELISLAGPVRAAGVVSVPSQPRIYSDELGLPSDAYGRQQAVEPLPVPEPPLDLAPAWVAEPPPIAAAPPIAASQPWPPTIVGAQPPPRELRLDGDGLPEFIPR